MIGFAVDVGVQSARAGIPERIQEALARSGTTRRAAPLDGAGGSARDVDPGTDRSPEPVAVGGAGTAP